MKTSANLLVANVMEIFVGDTWIPVILTVYKAAKGIAFCLCQTQ